jgi:hypothetical protein
MIYMSEKTVSVTPSVLLEPHKGGGKKATLEIKWESVTSHANNLQCGLLKSNTVRRLLCHGDDLHVERHHHLTMNETFQQMMMMMMMMMDQRSWRS